GAPVVHPHVRPLADPAQVVLAHHGGAAVVHAHVHVVGAVVGLRAVLDRVADRGTGDRTGDGRGVLAAFAVGLAVGDLATSGRADDAAEHGAGGIGHVALAHGRDFDAGHGAAVVAGTGRRRRSVVAAAVTGRRGGAAGRGQAGKQRGGAGKADGVLVHGGLSCG